jgi:hypothetical protein
VEGDVGSVAEEDVGHLEHQSQDRRPGELVLDLAAVEGESVRDVDAYAGVSARRVPESDRGGGRVDADVPFDDRRSRAEVRATHRRHPSQQARDRRIEREEHRHVR